MSLKKSVSRPPTFRFNVGDTVLYNGRMVVIEGRMHHSIKTRGSKCIVDDDGNIINHVSQKDFLRFINNYDLSTGERVGEHLLSDPYVNDIQIPIGSFNIY